MFALTLRWCIQYKTVEIQSTKLQQQNMIKVGNKGVVSMHQQITSYYSMGQLSKPCTHRDFLADNNF